MQLEKQKFNIYFEQIRN